MTCWLCISLLASWTLFSYCWSKFLLVFNTWVKLKALNLSFQIGLDVELCSKVRLSLYLFIVILFNSVTICTSWPRQAVWRTLGRSLVEVWRLIWRQHIFNIQSHGQFFALISCLFFVSAEIQQLILHFWILLWLGFGRVRLLDLILLSCCLDSWFAWVGLHFDGLLGRGKRGQTCSWLIFDLWFHYICLTEKINMLWLNNFFGLACSLLNLGTHKFRRTFSFGNHLTLLWFEGLFDRVPDIGTTRLGDSQGCRLVVSFIYWEKTGFVCWFFSRQIAGSAVVNRLVHFTFGEGPCVSVMVFFCVHPIAIEG